jgi:4-diphosphocytidyl-2-C-methyl-D-erythritol kinase
MYPEIGKVKKSLYEHNAVYASMTGTGSTVFGIFNRDENVEIARNKKYFYHWLTL